MGSEAVVSGRGYFGIGIEHTKKSVNVGTLWRNAALMGAAFMFTVGRRYDRQCSDTIKAWRHIPLHHFDTFGDFYNFIPYSCQLIGVEEDGYADESLVQFDHPERCVYLLGAEDHGLTSEAMERVHHIVSIPSTRSLNVATAGSIVMYDRVAKRGLSLTTFPTPQEES